MSYVNCARYSGEQNLVVVQDGDSIYYELCKDIPMGTELLVWYGEMYTQFMGIPVTLQRVEDCGGLPAEPESKLPPPASPMYHSAIQTILYRRVPLLESSRRDTL